MTTRSNLTKGKSNFTNWFVLALALGAMTFFGVCDPGGNQNSPIGGPAAKVDGQVVSMAEFRKAYEAMVDRLRSQNPDGFDPRQQKVAAQVVDQLVKERVMYLTALEIGLKASDAEVLKFLVEQKAFLDEKGVYQPERLEGYLRASGYSEASFMEEMRRYQTLAKLERLVQDVSFSPKQSAELEFRMTETKFDIEYLRFTPVSVKFDPSPEDIKAFSERESANKEVEEYYNNNKKDYVVEEKMQARHILVAHKDSTAATPEADKRTKEEAQARAAEILKKVKMPGADFVAIAKAETDEPSGKGTGGDLGFFTRETMVKEFSDAAFALKPGDISEVVESPFGFHIIKVEAYQEPSETSLEVAKDEIIKILLSREKAPVVLKERANETLSKLQAGDDVTKLLEAYGVSWQKTGSFAANTRSIPGIGLNDDVKMAVLTLKNPGEIYKDTIEVAGSYLIVRLIKREDADMKKFGQDRGQQMLSFESMYLGYSNYAALEQASMEKYNKKIYKNDAYLRLDQAPN